MSTANSLPLQRQVRAFDPDTSWDAAQAITVEGYRELKATILRLLSAKPATDEELYAEYVSLADLGWVARKSEQRVRTARAELSERDGPVVALDLTRPSRLGHPMTVWGVRA